MMSLNGETKGGLNASLSYSYDTDSELIFLVILMTKRANTSRIGVFQ